MANFLTLLQISDTHLFSNPSEELCGLNTNEAFHLLRKELRPHAARADAILATGDLSQDGSPSSYRRFVKAMEKFQKPVYALPGNHDRGPVLRRTMKGGLVQAVGSAQLGNWKLLFLDSTIPGSNDGRLNPAELKRLKKFFLRHRREPLLVSFHHHPIPVGSAWMDRMLLRNAAEVNRILMSAPNLRAVVFGHVHQSFQTRKDGVLFLGVPAGSLQFKPRIRDMRLDQRSPGFRWMHLFPDGRIQTGIRRLRRYPLKPNFGSTGY